MKKESNPIPKKKWARPKLIILTRGKPEEGVLAGCKDQFVPIGSSIQAERNGCMAFVYGPCMGICMTMGSS